MTDYEGAYRELRLRVTDLLRGRPDDVVEQIAPATPDWRVRDIVAHLGGVCDDITHGNMDGVGSDPWTQAQVAKRRDWPFDRVLDDWSEHAAVVEVMMNDIGQPMGQMLFDAWTHEQDVRGALGEPGAREGAAADIAWSWLLATSPRFEETVASLPASRYELLRAVTGRRSRAQVRDLGADGVELDGAMFADVFTPAGNDIVE